MTKIAVALLALCACSRDVPDPGPEKGLPTQTHAVALTGGTEVLVVAFTTSDNEQRLPEIVEGQAPRDFHWIAVAVPAARTAELYTDAGMRSDLSDVSGGVRFSQVYRDTCNPALENFSPCWLFESYSAGDDGLSGEVIVQLKDGHAIGKFDVTWEGNTDRFGPPSQWHRHSSLSGYAAELSGGVL